MTHTAFLEPLLTNTAKLVICTLFDLQGVSKFNIVFIYLFSLFDPISSIFRPINFMFLSADTRPVQKVSDLWPGKIHLHTWRSATLIPFKVVSL